MPLIVGSVQRRGLRMLGNFNNDAIALTKSFSTSCTSGGQVSLTHAASYQQKFPNSELRV
jgi:hypothetical protein